MIIGLSSMFYSNETSAQLAEEDIVVNAYYGLVPNKGAFFRLAEASADTVQGLTFNYLGPAGLQAQFMVSDRFGVGIDASYQSKQASYEGYSVNQAVVRAMVRTSWEFYNTEKFQINWANSVGYRNVDWSVTGEDAEEYDLSLLDAVSSPLALRSALGLRYLFTENIGLTMEFGLGGGNSINAGLAVKL